MPFTLYIITWIGIFLAVAVRYQRPFIDWATRNNGPITALATLMMMIFTGGLAYFSFLLYQVSDRTDQTGRVVQKAFVQAGPFVPQLVLHMLPSGQERVLDMVNSWENSGSTPAIGVVHHFQIAELSKEPNGKEFISLDKTPNDISYIGPKGTEGVMKEMPLSFYMGDNESPTMTVMSKRKIFLWGWIIYRDVFPGSEPHVTEACQVLTSVMLPVLQGMTVTKLQSISTNPGMSLTYQDCASHNCEDRYCADYETLSKLAPPPPPPF